LQQNRKPFFVCPAYRQKKKSRQSPSNHTRRYLGPSFALSPTQLTKSNLILLLFPIIDDKSFPSLAFESWETCIERSCFFSALSFSVQLFRHVDLEHHHRRGPRLCSPASITQISDSALTRSGCPAPSIGSLCKGLVVPNLSPVHSPGPSSQNRLSAGEPPSLACICHNLLVFLTPFCLYLFADLFSFLFERDFQDCALQLGTKGIIVLQ
jgi:hypothetical protein